VDLKDVWKRIHVVRVPDYSPHAVAEHAVALMLALNRKIHKAYNRTRDSNFSLVGLMGFDMHGRTAGVVGTGKIGKAVANILLGMGMRVLAYDPFPDEGFAKDKGIEYVGLKELLADSDVVTLHCPLNKDTYHIIDGNSLGHLKKGAMIVNTGRGALIDTTALIEALKERRVGAAGLDVYEEESEYFFEDFSSSFISDDVLARLLTFPNVLITSHQGFFTEEALGAIARTTLENVRDFFDGKALPNEICYKMCKEGCPKQEKGRCW
jgi:D-lactate dehydrogenase